MLLVINDIAMENECLYRSSYCFFIYKVYD